jgi:hypothetical protein
MSASHRDSSKPGISRASRNVLNWRATEHFPGDTLFHRVARAVCEAGCLPRKELYEAWETARRIRRVMRGGPVIELAAGHGLLSALLIILDDSCEQATCVDINKPASFAPLLATLQKHWPRLEGRIHYQEQPLEEVLIPDGALVASIHACGTLTDRVLDLALGSGSRVAVLPCCHDLDACDTGSLEGWIDGPLAVDTTRAARLRQAGYTVKTATIPEDISPKNRLLMGW